MSFCMRAKCLTNGKVVLKIIINFLFSTDEFNETNVHFH